MLYMLSLTVTLLLAPFGFTQQHPSSQPHAQQSSQPRNSNSIVPIPLDRAADSYAIYSLLMPGIPFDSMSTDQTRRWAIADATVSISDMDPAVPPDGQLKAPPDNVKAFNEALSDFEMRRYERFRLQASSFHLNHPYDLLSEAQVGQLRYARTSINASSDQQAQFAGYPGITFFSAVYFNNAQTAALVYMNDWCANLCAAGQWVYLEKQNGQWVRRSGIFAKGA